MSDEQIKITDINGEQFISIADMEKFLALHEKRAEKNEKVTLEGKEEETEGYIPSEIAELLQNMGRDEPSGFVAAVDTRVLPSDIIKRVRGV